MLNKKICIQYIRHGVSLVLSRSVTRNSKVDPDIGSFYHSFYHYCCLDIQEDPRKSDKIPTSIYYYIFLFLGIIEQVALWDLLCRYCPPQGNKPTWGYQTMWADSPDPADPVVGPVSQFSQAE